MTNMYLCNHEVLVLEPSPAAETAGFVRASTAQLTAAATSGKVKDSKQSATRLASIFPAPLVLPDDDLYLDPRYPPKSLRSWQRQKAFSTLTETRNKIYVAGPPTISGEASSISKWSCPNLKVTHSRMERPNTTDVSQYLQAFYHGLNVVMLPESTFTFAAWDESGSEPAGSIALNTTVESTRVRTRAGCDQIFAQQLNLDDLIDVAISSPFVCRPGK